MKAATPPQPSPYQALARKYRPASFEQVVGQESLVATLRNAITQGRLHHAYLFSGTRGVGKTTLARLFARALNCAEGPTITPCGQCDPCREIAAGSALDVIEIDGASNRKVEDVDPLREAARYAPARDRHKIFLIDEVHMLSDTAFNALLKILEEPPPRTLFLFATTEPGEVPETILSRCLHLVCRRVSRRDIAAAAGRICAAETIEASAEALDLIAHLAAGSMRDALSLLDQAIAYAGRTVTAESVRQGLGLIDRGMVLELLEGIARADAPGCLGVVERLSQAGADLTHFAREALSRARDAMVCKAAGSAAAAGLEGDEAAACEGLAGRYSADGLLRLTQALLDLSDRIRRDENPRFLLEVSILRMIRLADLTPLDELIRRLDALGPAPAHGLRPPGRSAVVTGAHAAAPAAASSAPARSAPSPVPQPPPAPTAAAVRTEAPSRAARSSQADRLVERIAARTLMLATRLRQARGLDIQDDQVIVEVDPAQEFLCAALEEQDALSLIREEASALLGRPATVQVRTIDARPDAAGATPAGPRERLMNEALAEPAVKAAMEMFKGQIVDIREGR